MDADSVFLFPCSPVKVKADALSVFGDVVGADPAFFVKDSTVEVREKKLLSIMQDLIDEVKTLSQKVEAQHTECEMLSQKVEAKHTECEMIRAQVNDHDFWLMNGTSPILAIFDSVRIYLHDLNDIARQCILGGEVQWPYVFSIATQLSKKRKKHDAYTYYMLLHERESDSTHHEEKKSCLEMVHSKVSPGLVGDGVFELLSWYTKSMAQRDDAGHPVARADKGKRREYLEKIDDLTKKDKLPEPYNNSQFRALIDATRAYFSGKDYGDFTSTSVQIG